MTITTTTDGPEWAVQTIKRITRSQRRHPQLWDLSCRLQHQANCLAHQIEDPPPGLDWPFDPAQVMALVAEIRRLCGDIEASIAGQAGTTKGGSDDVRVD